MTKEHISDALLEAFEEGFENIARRYPGSGMKVKLLRVRKILGLSQKDFADEFGIPFATVRNWEQPDRAEPTGAAKTLIDLIAADPKTVRLMLNKARTPPKPKSASLENAE